MGRTNVRSKGRLFRLPTPDYSAVCLVGEAQGPEREQALHSLRRTCASALILSGADTLEVAKFLGHANPTVTLSVYAHRFNTRRTGRTMATVAGAMFGDRGSTMVAVDAPEAGAANASS